MKKWLLVANCQTEGLKNSLTLLCPDIEIVALDIWSFLNSQHPWAEDIPSYAGVVATREVIDSAPERFVGASNLLRIPNFVFRAFHPDICYIRAGSEPLFSPLHDYHSAICGAAYKAGRSTDEAAKLYDGAFFEALGFFSLWDLEKSAIIGAYQAEDIDIRAAFLRWSRMETPFMYTFNHPKIEVVSGVAEAIAKKSGIEVIAPEYNPHDNLAPLSIFPVYPEIAERYGFRGGNYRFKSPGEYRTISLNEYIERSFGYFDKHDRASLTSDSPQFHAAYKLITESR